MIFILLFGLCSNFVLGMSNTAVLRNGELGGTESYLQDFWNNIANSSCDLVQWNDIINIIIQEENLNLGPISSLKINVVLVYLAINLDTICQTSSTECGPMINSTYQCFQDHLQKIFTNEDSYNINLFSKRISQVVSNTQNFELPDLRGIKNEEQLAKLCFDIVKRIQEANKMPDIELYPLKFRHDHSQDQAELETIIINTYGKNGKLTFTDFEHLLMDLNIGGYEHDHEHEHNHNHSHPSQNNNINHIHVNNSNENHDEINKDDHNHSEHNHDDHTDHSHMDETNNTKKHEYHPDHSHGAEHSNSSENYTDTSSYVEANKHSHENHTHEVVLNNTYNHEDHPEHIHGAESNNTHNHEDHPKHSHDAESNNTHNHNHPEHIHDAESNNAHNHDHPEHIHDAESNNAHNHDHPEHIHDAESNNAHNHDHPEHIHDTKSNNTNNFNDSSDALNTVKVTNRHNLAKKLEQINSLVDNDTNINENHTEISPSVVINKTQAFELHNQNVHMANVKNIHSHYVVDGEFIDNHNVSDILHNESHSRLRRHIIGKHSHFPECLKAYDFYHLYGLNLNQVINQNQLQKLCPILLHQIVSKSCKHEESKPNQTPMTTFERYGYGSFSVVIISLAAVLGIGLVPLMSSFLYDIFLKGFIALGVGTLAGDAILHLIPQCLGLHIHDRSDHNHEHGFPSYIWVALTVLAAIYVLFLLETLMQLVMHSTQKNHNHHNPAGHGHSHVPDISTFHSHSKKQSNKNGEIIHAFELAKNTKSEVPTGTWKSCSNMELSEFEQNSSMNLAEPEEDNVQIRSTHIGKGITTLGLVIILGDAIHNIADGLAIGAAFSVGTNDGISVSIAILCHEIPHELADFAILLSTGMSYKTALICNLTGAFTAFIGLYIGLYLGDDEYSRQWIFAIAAGMFLYVALGDLMMELIHPKNGFKWSVFIIENIGMLIGIGIMLVIALYEDKISIR